jgi:hypothetical protein
VKDYRSCIFLASGEDYQGPSSRKAWELSWREIAFTCPKLAEMVAEDGESIPALPLDDGYESAVLAKSRAFPDAV